MAIRHVRLAAWTLFVFALSWVHSPEIAAQTQRTQQPRATSPSKPGQNTNSTRQSARRPANTKQYSTKQYNAKQNSKQSRSQPRVATRPQTATKGRRTASQQQATANPNTAKPKAIETLDPEKRAAFLKLIGANWIWSPAHPKDNVPVCDCYFRKTFQLNNADFGQVHVACDNKYELYVNGNLVGSGGDWRKLDVHDVQKYLLPGMNAVAIKATNTDAGAAGLVARVVVRERGGTFESFSTDATWRTSLREFTGWTQPRMRDSEWLAAKVYGPLGGVLPWGDEIVIADEGSRFVTDPEFVVERLVTDEQAGSLIAMAFNSNGDILASREGGSLELIRDKDKDGAFESVEPFCTEVKNVQGILSLGNRVYAVGDGPEGGALYQLADADGDGRSDKVTALVKFRGVVGEHGPHTVRIGADGLLYILHGNFVQSASALATNSPYPPTYEGDLLLPRYEDPQGHAVGVPAPGGAILRTDTNASFVEMVAGGFRNPYDFTFNSDGEMFTYDADMEWDIGAPWYRPTRVVHVTPGGEYGWRSGWAKWPAYYLDSLPPTIDLGPGSPTGVVHYDHNMFPPRLQNTLFVGDWALGQINAVKLERDGATYKAKVTTFLKGRPLNVTGLDIGPDGALYFSTGGRGTDGGIYRVRWTGTPPPQTIRFGQGIQQALDQPQLSSDWARARVAAVKRSLGTRWESELKRVLTDKLSSNKDRLRAVALLTYFGPAPDITLLKTLARDADPAMRVRAARLMGNQSAAELSAPLAALLSDSDPWVRRVACEAIAHRGVNMPTEALLELLGDGDRFTAFAARRALEKVPAAEWEERVLQSAQPRQFLVGATALLATDPTPDRATRILIRCEQMLRGQTNLPGRQSLALSDANYLDLLRVVQLAYVRGKVAPADTPTLTQQLLREYPTRDAMMNRELAKLLAFLQPPGAAHALTHQLSADIPEVEKLQVAALAPRIATGWDKPDKLQMLSYLEQVRGLEGGHSLSGYIEFFARDFFTHFSLEERQELIARGEDYPASVLSVLAKLPEDPGEKVLAEIRALDARLAGKPGEPIARLRVGTVAVLGRSSDERSQTYLRNVYLHDPERRATVAMGLTQRPSEENWPILVDSLRTVEGDAAREILAVLTRIDRQPDKSEPYRNAIVLGLRLGAEGGELVADLMEKWVGQTPYRADVPLDEQLAAWQSWYATTFPNERPAELPRESQSNKWSYEELLSYLDSADGKAGSAARGAEVFKVAQCVACHRFNGRGEGIGPDLTTVAQRFTRKEILESIVYPNQVVSDQYASQVVTANGKTYTGIVARNPDKSVTVLQSDGKKTQLAAEEIEDIQPSNTSAMPEGLANRLTLEQLADLFAYITGSPEPNMAGRSGSPNVR